MSDLLVIGNARAAAQYAFEHRLNPHDYRLITRFEQLCGYRDARIVVVHGADSALLNEAEDRGFELEFRSG